MTDRPAILLLGPCLIEGDVVGGTKVMFTNRIAGFNRTGTFRIEIVNTSRSLAGRGSVGRALQHVVTMLSTLYQVLRRAGSVDLVMFNTSSRGAILAAPVIRLAAAIRRTPVVIRVFGGDLDLILDRSGRWQRWLAGKTLFQVPLLLLETEMLCRHFANYPNTRFLPNTRDLPPPENEPRRHCRRFLFLSQLRPEKGVGELLEASTDLPADCTITVCGPPMPGTDLGAFDHYPKVRIMSAVSPSESRQLLVEHDALLLPSYYPGEGIPGIILEAVQSGLPVITTRWRGLPDLVTDGTDGFVIEPRSIEELAKAMRKLATDPEQYRALAKGAVRLGEAYRSQRWHDRLERSLLDLVGLTRQMEIPALPHLELVPVPGRQGSTASNDHS